MYADSVQRDLPTGEQGVESPCGGRRSVVQAVPEGGAPSGGRHVGLALLEELAAGLQELGENCPLQLEGEREPLLWGLYLKHLEATVVVWAA